jgi:hypothetical protein
VTDNPRPASPNCINCLTPLDLGGTDDSPRWECANCGLVLISDPLEREELDDGDYQAREVFAQYGLTSYVSQVLEKAILNVLTLRQVAKSETPSQEGWDARFSVNAKLPMGRLIGAFETHYPDDAEVVTLLRDALPKRNYIAHTFFWDNAVRFTTTAGREAMLVELHEIREIFQSVESVVGPLAQREFTRSGMSAERFQELLDGAHADLRAEVPEA